MFKAGNKCGKPFWLGNAADFTAAAQEEAGEEGSPIDSRDGGAKIKSRSSSLKSSSGSARGTPKLERKVSFVDEAVAGKDDSRTLPKATPASEQGQVGVSPALTGRKQIARKGTPPPVPLFLAGAGAPHARPVSFTGEWSG